MTINAYAATFARARLAPFTYEPGPLGEDDVEIQISHCGICHSDVHLVDGDWGDVFPCVPGHEIVGAVIAGGGFGPGERVGVGWQRYSCGTCEYCRAGEEVLCPETQATCMGHFGGFADRIVINRRFVFRIPEALASETAAPLLCGGITVYSPLLRFAEAGSKVGVIGIGGLGHLGLQFAKARGCEVTAFSRSADKETEARSFGADHFVVGDPVPGSLDLVLNTAHAVPDMAAFMMALRPKGVFCQLGATATPLSVDSMPLIMGQRMVTGSAIGHPAVIREMLALAAEKGIQATSQVVPMEQANEALDRTRKNLARYRMVLER